MKGTTSTSHSEPSVSRAAKALSRQDKLAITYCAAVLSACFTWTRTWESRPPARDSRAREGADYIVVRGGARPEGGRAGLRCLCGLVPSRGIGEGATMRYRIRVAGHLDPSWTEWFEGLAITNLDSGDTVLVGPVVDQSMLHGLLTKIRDLGLELVEVEREGPAGAPGSDLT